VERLISAKIPIDISEGMCIVDEMIAPGCSLLYKKGDNEFKASATTHEFTAVWLDYDDAFLFLTQRGYTSEEARGMLGMRSGQFITYGGGMIRRYAA
jgi:hypothetical protein